MKRIHRHGFSLSEGLIACLLVSLILLLGFPALRLMTARNREMLCLSKMRQLGTAIQLYRSEHNQYLPPNKTDPPGITLQNTWSTAIRSYVQVTATQPARIGADLRPFLTCPARPESQAPALQWQWWYSDYGVNAHHYAFGFTGEPHRLQGELLSKMLMIGETKSFLRSIRPTASGLNVTDFRHEEMMQVLFFDGHVGKIRQQDLPTHFFDPFWSGQPL